jgi:hypothetical protein
MPGAGGTRRIRSRRDRADGQPRPVLREYVFRTRPPGRTDGIVVQRGRTHITSCRTTPRTRTTRGDGALRLPRPLLVRPNERGVE